MLTISLSSCDVFSISTAMHNMDCTTRLAAVAAAAVVVAVAVAAVVDV